MAQEKTGINALLDALKQAGAEFDGGSGPSASAGTGGEGRARASSSGGSQEPPEIKVNFPFGEQMAQWGRRALIIAAVALVLVVAGCYWWFHPPINIHSADTWYFVIIFILIPIFFFLMTRYQAYQKGTAKVTRNEGKAKAYRGLSYIPVAIVLVGILGWIASMPIFPGNAERYAHVLQTDRLDFAEDIKEVNYSEVPIIDRNSAALLGNRAMGMIPEYVSQFEISPLYSQINYKQNPVRVSPLGYADIFKWWANRQAGIPAYVLVNMTTQDTSIVKLDEGIKYSQSEPLGRNIDRYVQLKYPFYMFDSKSFEIDDEGHPWWICPVKQFTIGLFGGLTISRVVLCDAATGECTDIPIEECPQWVDRVYPAELVIQQYNWSGAYMSGWLNSWLGQQGVVQTTPGTSGQLGYNYIAKDDDVWVYSGVTSATADNSIVGFVLVNQRTAQSHFYAVAGATEESAMYSAEGQVQHLRYRATFPILLNINNQPTYFMALKDDAGLVKMYAMLDIKRYQNVAVADTVSGTQKAYTQLLVTNGVLTEEEGTLQAGSAEASGTIVHMATAVVEGNSHFYLRLAGDTNIYDFALPALLDIVAYGVGDHIEFTYFESDPTFIAVEITSEAPVAVAGAPASPGSKDDDQKNNIGT
ncbi:MAG: Tat pathway signal sequence [Eggerthellaceae bacterium]|nr:Tat pathway signal sequence [Eggerthellaceae bacterium]MDR2715582.1 Tat pathway signal sequence [Coriobacteriaceae bacterium]